MPIDTTPANTPVTPPDSTSLAGGDGYGSSSIAFGTAIAKVAPAKPNCFTIIKGFNYDCGTTAHNVTVMPVKTQSTCREDAASGQTVIKVASVSGLTAGDYISVKDSMNLFCVYLVASISGTSVTITVSVGSADSGGFVNEIPTDRIVWFHGSPGVAGSNSSRNYRMKASSLTPIYCDTGIASSFGVYEPIVVVSDNATATGYLTGPFFTHQEKA